MSSKRQDKDFLRDILEAMQRVASYTQDSSYKQFMGDTKTQDAVLRNMEVIGEATKGLSTSLKKLHPTVPWKDMAGMRDKVIHHYFGVNYDIVWNVAKEQVPQLIPRIESTLEQLKD
ncbi:MAG: DUF86 domain-containing protein [Elusimicrobia bacterium]|nr:DUF86 domain-containing protein [Elusimicrobiota bacterium]